MSATLYQVAGALVPPSADARLYNLLLGQIGVAEGCEITSLGGTVLHIADGWGVVQGRVWSIAAQDISVTASISGAINGRLLLRLDTSLAADSAAQLVTQAAATLPALTQEDTLSGGSVYELPLATYSVSETTITNLNQVFPPVASITSMLDKKADLGGVAYLKTLFFGDSASAIPMFGITNSGDFVMRWVDGNGVTRMWTMATIMAAVEAVGGKAPTSHASTDTTYGAGTGSNYGHVKLSDSTSSTSAASAGIAATPKAVKAAYDAATAAQDAANGKAAANHTQAASTITTGTFPANVKANETARTARGLFNEETRSGSATGTLQSVKYFINVI